MGVQRSSHLSSKDLSNLVLTARAQYSEISLKFYDHVIDFPGKGSATVNLTANIRGRLRTGDHVDDIHELICKLRKVEDIWYLKEVEVVEVMKR